MIHRLAITMVLVACAAVPAAQAQLPANRARPSTGPGNYGLEVEDYVKRLARLEQLQKQALEGGILVRYNLGNVSYYKAMTKAEFRDLVVELIIDGKLGADEVAPFVSQMTAESRRGAADLRTRILSARTDLEEARARARPAQPGVIARAGAAGSPAASGGATYGRIVPGSAALVPMTETPVDGAIETPTIPSYTPAPAAGRAPRCPLPHRWRNYVPGVGSSTWIVDAGGGAREEGMGDAPGRASLSGGNLVIQWEDGGYAGFYSVTLDRDCNGTGTLQFTRSPGGARSFDATFTSAGSE